MPVYEAIRFDPPAPVAQVVVRNPQSGNSLRGITMLLDSGADVTLVPRSVVNSLGIAPATDQVYELMGFDGTISRLSVAYFDMVFLSRTIRGQFILIDQEWGIIGRDVLNLVAVLLDGPRLTWGEQPHR